jgi:hypothetical protein
MLIRPREIVGKFMSRVQPFYSIRELYQPVGSRFYHNNGQCAVGSMIKAGERLHGMLQYRLCSECDVRNMEAGDTGSDPHGSPARVA